MVYAFEEIDSNCYFFHLFSSVLFFNFFLFCCKEYHTLSLFSHHSYNQFQGVILFACKTATTPFHADSIKSLKSIYRNQNIRIKLPSNISGLLADLLMGLLQVNPTKRFDYDIFFSHPFTHREASQGCTAVSDLRLFAKDIPQSTSSKSSTATSANTALLKEQRISTSPQQNTAKVTRRQTDNGRKKPEDLTSNNGASQRSDIEDNQRKNDQPLRSKQDARSTVSTDSLVVVEDTDVALAIMEDAYAASLSPGAKTQQCCLDKQSSHKSRQQTNTEHQDKCRSRKKSEERDRHWLVRFLAPDTCQQVLPPVDDQEAADFLQSVQQVMKPIRSVLKLADDRSKDVFSLSSEAEAESVVEHRQPLDNFSARQTYQTSKLSSGKPSQVLIEGQQDEGNIYKGTKATIPSTRKPPSPISQQLTEALELYSLAHIQIKDGLHRLRKGYTNFATLVQHPIAAAECRIVTAQVRTCIQRLEHLQQLATQHGTVSPRQSAEWIVYEHGANCCRLANDLAEKHDLEQMKDKLAEATALFHILLPYMSSTTVCTKCTLCFLIREGGY